MASKSDAILLRIGADVSGATQGIGDLNRQVGGLSKSVETGASTLLRFAGIAAAGLGLQSAINNALAFGDSMVKLAQQTGLSTDAVQRLDFIAGQTGTSVEAITSGINKMQLQLVKAADGAAAQAEAFALLNINTEEFFRLKPDEQFQRIAEEIANTTNPADQTAKAIAAFGKAGAEMLPTLKAMGEQGAKLSAEFDKIGGPVSEDAIRALDDMGDAATRVSSSTRAFVSELLAMAAPAVVAAMDGVTAFFGGLRVLTGNGANEMVNLDMEIERVESTIAALQARAGQRFVPDVKPFIAELAELKAKYKELEDAPMKAAQAAIAASKIQTEQRAVELEDIIVHGEAKHVAVIDAEMKLYQESLALRMGMQAQAEAAARDHELILGDITKTGMDAREEFTWKSYEAQASTIFGELESITAGVAQHNKVLFNINKAAGIANAIISMHEGVAKSLASYPMPVAAVMAAIHAAAGLARVSAIASTQYNGGGKGAAPSQAGTPATPTVPAGNGGSGGGGGGGGTQQVLTVNGITPSSLLTGNMVRELATRLSEHVRDGGRVEWAK